MKKIGMITAMAVLIVSLSGCLSTLYPLFTEKDIVFKPNLTGTWKQQPGDKEYLVIRKAGTNDLSQFPSLQKMADKAYVVFNIDENKKTEKKYCTFLTQLGGNLYFDFFPLETERQQQYDDFYKRHYTPMHSFYGIRLLNDQSFQLGMLKEDFLKQLIDTKRIRIQHEVYVDGSFIITAPTSELQQYVIKYGNVPEAYESNDTYFKQ